MTQEEKDLLLKDLCAKLPYGVKVQVYYEDIAGSGFFDETVWSIDNDEPFHVNDRWIENIKPYLRPMSSMTEEEDKEWHSLMRKEYREQYPNSAVDTSYYEYFPTIESFDYLYSRHLDFRGLIPMNLALEAPEGMYK